MLQYILAGLALGSIYAIAASGLVVTFVSGGVLKICVRVDGVFRGPVLLLVELSARVAY